MDINLKGKVALVAGAIQPLGYAAALAMAREGGLDCVQRSVRDRGCGRANRA
jgi:NAD(P)-dependent dehydrogenase (short-subunit alcohol dehydrogenase family)